MARAEEGTQEESLLGGEKKKIRREDEQLMITLNSRCGCGSLFFHCPPKFDNTSHREMGKQ